MKKQARFILGVVVALLVVVAACSSDSKSSTSANGGSTAARAGRRGGAKPTITIGAQKFDESGILAQIYKQGLEAKGFTVNTQDLGGFRDVELQAFDGAMINFVSEYAASMLNFKDKGAATGDAQETVGKLKTTYDSEGIVPLDVSNAVDTNAFVMTKSKADQLGITSLSDLASKGATLKVGGPADCETNPYCVPGLKATYGLDVSSSYTTLQSGTTALQALTSGSIDVAVKFSTDGDLEGNSDVVVLKDDKHMLAADNVVPVVSKALAGNSDLVTAVNNITKVLTTDDLIAMNKKDVTDKEDLAAIAKEYLQSKGLL